MYFFGGDRWISDLDFLISFSPQDVHSFFLTYHLKAVIKNHFRSQNQYNYMINYFLIDSLKCFI